MRDEMVIPRRDTVALSAMFESLKILKKLQESDENSRERKRQEEILASFQNCTRKLLD